MALHGMSSRNCWNTRASGGRSRALDIRVHDERLFGRVLRDKNLGLGEAYMDGWWDCQRLDELFRRVLAAHLDRQVRGSLRLMASLAPALLFNRQTRRRSKTVAEHHYNLDNDLFRSFLDPCIQYSCAYFRNGESLEQAQRAKLKLICDKLALGPGDHLLDIGCGWGGLARYAAETRGCKVTAVNIAKEQIALPANTARACPWRSWTATTATSPAPTPRSCPWACSSTWASATTGPTCRPRARP
jgi:cyclopropane-fatty-acyl-phospholipid synthase